jgi:hypothetical protein
MKIMFITIALALIPLGLSLVFLGRHLAHEGRWPTRKHSESIEAWQRRLRARLLYQRIAQVVGWAGLGLAAILLVALGVSGEFGGHRASRRTAPTKTELVGVD